MQATGYEHVVLDEAGVPWLAGTRVKLVEIVLETIAYGWSPDEIQFQHPHLSLGQIHSALAYYWDHEDELNRDIERRLQYSDQARQAAGPSSLAARLRSRRPSA